MQTDQELMHEAEQLTKQAALLTTKLNTLAEQHNVLQAELEELLRDRDFILNYLKMKNRTQKKTE
jgi:uncharacterized protein (DUF3084 family)